jgi:repressor LexA
MNRLKELREMRGLYQGDIAKILGISTPAYSYYESGKRNMSAETAQKLARFFNVSVDYLLGSDVKNKNLLPVLGIVKAGYDYLANENIIDYIDPHMTFADPENYFGLKVKGESMSPLFDEGDYIIVHKQDGDFSSNDICVVLINGEEGTVKKVVKTEEGIELHAFNPYFPVKKFTYKEMQELPVRIMGVVVRQIRNWK